MVTKYTYENYCFCSYCRLWFLRNKINLDDPKCPECGYFLRLKPKNRRIFNIKNGLTEGDQHG